MKLYKRCGFQMVQFLEGFYVIDGVSYDSYLYLLYLDELRRSAPAPQYEATRRGAGDARDAKREEQPAAPPRSPPAEPARDDNTAADDASADACSLG